MLLTTLKIVCPYVSTKRNPGIKEVENHWFMFKSEFYFVDTDKLL